MTVISIEWADDFIRVRWADGAGVHVAGSLVALAERLAPGSVLLCEPSFYSCNSEERRFLASELALAGQQLVPVARRPREILETLAGPVAARSRVGWLRAISLAGSAALDHRVLGAHEHSAVHGALDVAHAVALGGVALPALAAAREGLGPYDALDEHTRLALGDGQDYHPALLAAIALGAAAAPSRDDFERLLGLSNTPGWGSIRTAVRSWYATRNTGPDGGFARESVLTWSAYRRALREAYGRIATARRQGTLLAA